MKHSHNSLLEEGFQLVEGDLNLYGKKLSDTKFRFVEIGLEGIEDSDVEIDLADFSRETILHKLCRQHSSEYVENLLVENDAFRIAEHLFDAKKDLFNFIEDLPEPVKSIVERFGKIDSDSYDVLEELLAELKPHGYTFEYYLDGSPFNLKKIS